MTMTYALVPTTPDHCTELLNNLRPGDAAELALLLPQGGRDPGWLWSASSQCEEVLTAVNERKEVICIFGVTRSSDDLGVVWLLGTPLLDGYIKSLCREALGFVHLWASRFRAIGNITHKHNRKILAWIKWLGFDIAAEVEINGEPFILFRMENHV